MLELDATAAGQGGVDHFYVYTIGAGDEHVQFTGIAGDYVAWDDAPWSFLCDLTGPCCMSDGAATCEFDCAVLCVRREGDDQIK